METDSIARVEIDTDGRLLVYPSTQTFPLIYREGVEVNWDASLGALYSPVPRQWSYARWFKHILDTAQTLRLTPQTEWRNVSPSLQEELLQVLGGGA